jgi:hypothetical protein
MRSARWALVYPQVCCTYVGSWPPAADAHFENSGAFCTRRVRAAAARRGTLIKGICNTDAMMTAPLPLNLNIEDAAEDAAGKLNLGPSCRSIDFCSGDSSSTYPGTKSEYWRSTLSRGLGCKRYKNVTVHKMCS